MRVVGVDPSLTGTGLAWTDDRGRLGMSLIKTTAPKKGTATVRTRHGRLAGILGRVSGELLGTDLLAIEAPSYGSVGGAKHDRSGLWWLITDLAYRMRVPVVEIAPRTRALYATGNGAADKDEVIQACSTWLKRSSYDDNEVDAAVLAAMGARHLGHPIDGAEQPHHKRAMAGVAWPTMKGRTA